MRVNESKNGSKWEQMEQMEANEGEIGSENKCVRVKVNGNKWKPLKAIESHSKPLKAIEK